MLSPAMTGHALRSVLCCLAALLLGLEPAGSALLAASSHTPACRADCGTERAPLRSLAAPASERGNPLLGAQPGAAHCALVPPARQAGHSLGPRTCNARRDVRAELARCQRTLALVWSPVLLRAPAAQPLAPARSRAALGAAGPRLAHGAARAAALGVLLL